MNWGESAMTFKVSLFNKGLVASDLKRFWWVSALYGLFLFLILPFQHMMREIPVDVDHSWVREMLQRSLNIFSGQNGLQIVLICTVPVILAVLLFNYLHNSRAAAVLHSLPFNRNTLFCSHIAAGLALLLLPVVANGLVLIILQTTTHLKECYSLLNILQWMGQTALFDILFFAITVFVGMFTGHAGAHIAFAYILQVLPTGLCLLLVENLRHLLYGYADVNRISILPYDFPLMLLADGTDRTFFTAGTVAVYLLVAVLFLAAAAYVYKLRHAEAAGEVVAFASMRPVFKYGVTACTMLLAGVYFAGVSGGALPIIIVGYVIGSLLGYLTAEILLQKSLQVWSSYKGYLGYVAVITVLLLGITIDVTGYVHRVPAPEQVQKVYFGSNISGWIHLEKMNNSIDRNHVYGGSYFFTDRENIKNITLLHRQLLQKPHARKGINCYIIYTLDNGAHLLRQYNIDEGQYASALQPIYESLEYKEARFPVVAQDPAEIKLIEIGDHRTSKRPALLTDSVEIEEFAARLKQDVLQTSFAELTAGMTRMTIMEENVYINIVDVHEKERQYALRPGYKSVIAWLKEKGYYEQILLLPEEVKYVELFKAGSTPQRVEIRDPQLIAELLSINGPFNYNTGPEKAISITFYGKTTAGPFWFHRTIHRDWPVSEALNQYLKQLH